MFENTSFIHRITGFWSNKNEEKEKFKVELQRKYTASNSWIKDETPSKNSTISKKETSTKKIQEEFENIGYKIYTKVMKCNLHGIPQNRQRLIIVGIKSELNQSYEFPEEQENNTNLKDIIQFSTFSISIQTFSSIFLKYFSPESIKI